MARASARMNYFTFIGGKISDINPLVPPENSARILDNIDLEPNGRISRRLGIDFETDNVLSGGPHTSTDIRNNNIGVFQWRNVNNTVGSVFLVVRFGNTLSIYDESASPISSGFIEDVDISSLSQDVVASAKGDFQGSEGKGLFFCSGTRYDPFYLKYDVILNTFSVVTIKFDIRDFEGITESVPIDQRPTTLTNVHKYNLQNQGWQQVHIDQLFTDEGFYPSNADIEVLGYKINSSGDRVWRSNELIEHTFGNTYTPKGHFIIDAFDRDRSLISGISSLPTDGTTSRPAAVAFFAGRVWFGSVKGEIFFSQIVEGEDNISKFYQEQDPTSEEFNELLDTDGGVLKILDAGEVVKLIAIGAGLLVLATNGVWFISGGESGFSANNTKIDNLSRIKISNAQAAVEAEGSVFLWSEEGIYALRVDQVSGTLTPVSLSDNRIQSDFNQIPASGRQLAQAAFDRVDKRIYWSYHDSQVSTADNISGKYNAVLVYDMTLDAFWDYHIAENTNIELKPFMAGLFLPSIINEGSSFRNIVVGLDQVTVLGVPVGTTVTFDNVGSAPLKALTLTPTGGNFQFTLSEFCSRTFSDWVSNDNIGVNFNSAVETNPETLDVASLDKSAMYITTFYDYKRGGFADNLFTPRPDPSFGFLSSQSVIEIVRTGIPSLRDSQSVLEVVRVGEPDVRSSQQVLEVLRSF